MTTTTAAPLTRVRTLSDSHDLYRFDRAADPLPEPEAALTSEARAAYDRDGFLAVTGVLTPAEVEEAKQELHALLHRQVERQILQPEVEVRDRWDTMTAQERVDSVRKMYRFIQFSDFIAGLAKTHPTIQKIITHLVGEPCNLIQDMAMLKPPRIGVEKPWHQDAAYFEWAPPERVIGIWIALDRATAENGCMHALPGTHNEGPAAHYHLRDCQIPDERVQVHRDTLVPLEPGGVMFFSSLLHHGTPPNASPHRRWALQFHYAGETCTKIPLRAHADMFFDGDIYAGCRHANKPLTELPEP